MRPVAVRILHPDPAPGAGPLARGSPPRGRELAERHRVGLSSGRGRRRPGGHRPPDDTPFGRAAPRPWSVPIAAGRARRPRFRGAPAGHGRRPSRASWRPPGPTTGVRSPTTATRPTSWRSPGAAEPRGPARISPATTRCRAGSTRSPATRSATCGGGGGSQSTSTRPLDVVLTSADRPARPLGRRSTSGAGLGRALAGDPCVSRRTRRPSSSSPGGRRRRPPLARARDGIADAGPRRGARLADARRPGQRPRCVRARRCCSSATGRTRSGASSAALGDAALVDTPGPAGPSARRRRGGLAGGRGPVRVRPAAPRPDRGSVAAGPDRVGRGGADPGPAGRAHARRAGCPARRSAARGEPAVMRHGR